MKQAVYLLNRYLAATLGDVIKVTEGFAPIFPVQEMPEPDDWPRDRPYLIYTTRTSPALNQWWIMQDETTYTIHTTDLDIANDIAFRITDNLRRLDESAADLNSYLRANGETEVDFLYVRVMATYDPNPVGQENGRYSKPVTVRYEYTVDGTGVQ